MFLLGWLCIFILIKTIGIEKIIQLINEEMAKKQDSLYIPQKIKPQEKELIEALRKSKEILNKVRAQNVVLSLNWEIDLVLKEINDLGI